MRENSHQSPSLRIALLVIGQELLQGKTKDANTFWLSRFLVRHHLSLEIALIVPDHLETIVNSTRLLLDTFDLVITSGGLGPTCDDVTKEAMAKVFDKHIVFNQAASQLATLHYARLDRSFDPSFNRYDQLPEGFLALANPVGLAPGFSYEWAKGKWLISAPGVPKEFAAMLEEVLPKHFPKTEGLITELFVARTWGMAEEKIFKELCPTLWNDLKSWGAVSSLPHAMGVDIGVAIAESSPESVKHVASQVKQFFLNSAISPHIWQFGPIDLPEFVLGLAKERHMTIATAESCTGGLVASRLTDVAGSSLVFRGSIVAYHEDLKMGILDVPEQIIASAGIVSETVAKLMALGVKDLIGSHFGISTTGIAGPTGGTDKIPVGTVWIAVAGPKQVKAFHYLFKGDREMIKFRASQAALHHLREELLLC